MKIKKLLALLLVLCLTLAMVPATAFAESETSGTCGKNLTWSFDESTGTLTISGHGEMEGYDYYVNIAPWRSIDQRIENIVILEGVTSIGDYAFDECTSLKSILLPDSLASIGHFVFHGCTSLSSITLPDKLTSIEDCTFRGCTSLSSISLPDRLTSIGNAAFWGCTSLESIVLPDRLTSIGGCAFDGCSSLKSIVLPDSLSSIGEEVFTGCNGLESITVSTENRAFSSKDGVLFNKNMTTLVAYPAGRPHSSYVVPDSVTLIGSYAFEGCTTLTSVVITDAHTSIGSGAFYKCTSLRNIVLPYGLSSIGYSAFWGCTSLKSIELPSSLTSLKEDTFRGCTDLRSIVLPNGITVIEGRVFHNCTNLSIIQIPDTVRTIASNAFCNCHSLKDIYYAGSKEKWEQIHIANSDNGNDPLLNATIHFNSKMPSSKPEEPKPEESETCALDELQPIDFLAFSNLSYTTDLPVGETIRNALDDKWDKMWNGTDITYGELFEHIAGWQILEIGKDDNTGFFARAFRNAANEIVIAYRGSAEVGKEGWEADWVLNNLAMFAGNEGQQIGQAFQYYNYLLGQYQPKTVAVTGHSLGGALADIVSARYGNKGLSFNSAPFLDIAYQYYPIEMSENFHGVAYYNFVDIANQYDVVGNYTADAIERYLDIGKEFLFNVLDGTLFVFNSNREACKQKIADFCSDTMTKIHNKFGQELERIKPKEVCEINYWKNSDKNDLFYPHSLQSLVTRDESGKVVLTDMISFRKPNDMPITQWHTTLEINNLIKRFNKIIEEVKSIINTPTNAYFAVSDIISLINELKSEANSNSHELILGVDQRFTEHLSWQSKDKYGQVFGGDGVDKYVTSIRNDTIVGGWGNDELDGSYGDDIYYYHKGDGVDIIRDIAGYDKLVLCGFSENATIDRVKKGGWILVSVDGELIATVLDSRAMPTKNPFDIDLAENMTGEPKESPKINIDFSGGKYYKNHIVIACPVNVEIYNSKTGEVVYTLTDGEEGSYYTDYGNFYIVSEENGDGYAKVLDLLDGYDLRILGNGEGTMNVDVYDSDGHELAEAVSANDVPVIPSMVATIEEVGEQKNLVIDYDGDGVTDSVVPLAAPVVVSFDANGGTGEMAEVSVAAGGAYELPECGFIAPEGQTFQGWDVSGAVYAPGDKVTVTEDVTIKALWSAASGGVTPPSGESGGSQTPPTQGPVPTVTPPSTGGEAGSTTAPSTRPTSPNDTPRTGDFSTPALWVCLMAASGLAAAVLARTGKKKRK